MKKVLAGIMAVVLTMGVMTACGSTAKDGTDQNTGGAVVGDDIYNNNDSSDKNSPEYDFEVEYNTSIELSKEELGEYVDRVLQLTKAIQQNDKETARKVMNVDLAMDMDMMDETDTSDEGMDEYFENTEVGGTELTADMSAVKKVKIMSDEYDGRTFVYLEIYLDENSTALIASAIKGHSGTVVYLIGVSDAEDDKEINAYPSKSRLKDANGNAKTGYNIIAEALADAETMGYRFEEAFLLADVDCNSEPSYQVDIGATEEYLAFCLQKTLSSFGDGGYVYVICDPDTSDDYWYNFYVQWRESPDSDVIGQYPEAPSSVDDEVVWGEIFHGD